MPQRATLGVRQLALYVVRILILLDTGTFI